MTKKTITLSCLILLCIGSLIVFLLLTSSTELPTLPALQQTNQNLTIKYYGTSTLLFDDGKTQVMTDGFFSRPDLFMLTFKAFAPDTQKLKKVVSEEQLDRLAVIIPVHSHHDHAMDSPPPLAELTGAAVLGSQTTTYIAQGWGLKQSQINVAQANQSYQFGDFQITLIPSKHIEMPKFIRKRIGMGGKLNAPLKQPARLSDYKEGISYSVHIQHPTGSYLIQGSANYEPGALDKFNADTVFLGIAGLGNKTNQYLESYLQEVVFAVKAKQVIPIHWESFSKPAENKPLPKLVDDIEGSIKRLQEILHKKNISLPLLPITEL